VLSLAPRALPPKDLEREESECCVRESAGDEADSRRNALGVLAAVQRIVNRPNEAPERVCGETDDDHDQDHFSERVAGQPHKASLEIGGLAATLPERDTEREIPHHAVENAADHVAQAHEQLELGVGRGTLDRVRADLGRVGAHQSLLKQADA
jgi:hypothetical protein